GITPHTASLTPPSPPKRNPVFMTAPKSKARTVLLWDAQPEQSLLRLHRKMTYISKSKTMHDKIIGPYFIITQH
ncbi:MAG: hypothetical protein ACRC5N_04490, partial [Plesiomonas sp.]